MCVCVCGCSTACKGGLNSHLSYSACHLFSIPCAPCFKEAHAFISAEKVDDVTEEKIRAELSKAQAHTPTQRARRSSRSADKEELVVSLLQYLIYTSDGDKDFHIHIVTQFRVETSFYRFFPQ